MGLLGSGAGTENLSTPLGLVVLLTPSLLLGSSFLVLVVSIDQITSPDREVWSHSAVAFATVYAVLISITYFVQLTRVAPRLVAGRTQGIESFLFTPFPARRPRSDHSDGAGADRGVSAPVGRPGRP